ncbi:hypothetical protein [Ferruginibacter sp. HRS2-29]|uniref:hypothetical protein n=1 Tax=Ferruginibacter sp. HRS2-29 TaxID=2487334 RepID=UPI0020CD1B3A|nr:hypothetical protein [Ferruginibacter sp. HRS2-29]MCP9753170.1 hypothetical protein [Ferruginibacter sp. HRS2-29]
MKLIYLFPLLLLAAGCRSNDQKKTAYPVIVNTVPVTDSLPRKTTDAPYYWEADLTQQEGLVVKRSATIPADSLNPVMMTARLNGLYPEVPFLLKKISNDTAYIRVTDSRYLSRQMGSSGPEAWMAEVVYNLTEVPDIRYVNIDFKVRDHGAPGTYSRTDFTMR